MRFLAYFTLLFLLFEPTFMWAQINIKDPNIKGFLWRYEKVPSKFVAPRNVDVWLPEDYKSDGSVKYSVLYVHDGQNLFYPAVSFSGEEWGLDEAMDSLLRLGQIRRTIVVGIWNTPSRLLEYTPDDKYNPQDSVKVNKPKWEMSAPTMPNAYLKFIFEELKPMIDSSFYTKTDMKNTFMMGAGMAGLISLNAFCKYPDVIKGIAGIGMQWPVSFQEKREVEIQRYIDFYGHYLPNPALHKIYFDVDASHKNAWNMRQQEYLDEQIYANAYQANKNFLSLIFDDKLKQESEWRKRLGIPLYFLLKP
ncbi:MAG: hypothetical protein MH472_06960 [Bacteroidia bacterium]|nr:hypothetical protein [Bacteroidia bacterium]